MDTKEKQLNLWQQAATQTPKAQNIEPLFYNKAFIESFFEANISIAKELLRSENLLFNSIIIEFSTSNYCYTVSINVSNYRKFYNDSLEYDFVRSTPTANIKQAIESAILQLKNLVKIEPPKVEPEAIKPDPTPEAEQTTLESAISETKKTKQKEVKPVKTK